MRTLPGEDFSVGDSTFFFGLAGAPLGVGVGIGGKAFVIFMVVPPPV